MWIGTAAQCREIDRYAIEELGIDSMLLMENAGKAVFETVQNLNTGGPVLIACGPGNNGGDGLVVARLLKESGTEVFVYLAGSEGRLTRDCRSQLERLHAMGVKVAFHQEPGWETLQESIEKSTLVVDALLGTGQIGEPSGAIRDTVVAIDNAFAHIVSVDVPTGIVTDSGDAPGAFVEADATVSFELAKPCFFQGVGADACGNWQVADIGIPEEAFKEPTGVGMLEDETVNAKLGMRGVDSHKYENGHVLIVAGSFHMRGAALLAAQGALQIGAGIVTVAGVTEVCDAVAAQLPEALVLPLDEEEGVISTDAVEMILDFDERYHAAVFGPGMSTHEAARNFLKGVWQEWSLPCVIDADALNAISLGLSLPDAQCVLTPHPGEMARLLGSSSDKVQADRFGCTEKAVEKYGCTVLLKGAYSVTGEPGSNLLVNRTGNPGMATAGMGDVLAGVIAGLLAQGIQPFQAASVGAHIHGLAGDICADEIGSVGFLASDVASHLPAARAKLEECYEE